MKPFKSEKLRLKACGISENKFKTGKLQFEYSIIQSFKNIGRSLPDVKVLNSSCFEFLPQPLP
jgi:hypothetical protein